MKFALFSLLIKASTVLYEWRNSHPTQLFAQERAMRRRCLPSWRRSRWQGVLTPEPINSSQSSSSLNSSLRLLAIASFITSATTPPIIVTGHDETIRGRWPFVINLLMVCQSVGSRLTRRRFNCGVHYTWVGYRMVLAVSWKSIVYFLYQSDSVIYLTSVITTKKRGPISCMKVPIALRPNHTYGMSIKIFQIYIRPVFLPSACLVILH